MRTKKGSNKTSDKTPNKIKVNKSLRNDSKAKPNPISSSERLCLRCKAHELTVAFKGHICPNSSCNCARCNDYLERCRRINEKNKQKRLEKKSTKTGNSSATNQLVASLKKRTKKILINKETVPTVNGTERRKAGRKKKKHNKSESGDGVQTVVRQNQVIGVDDDGSNPPRLIPQQRVETQAKVAAIESSSATDIEANHSNRTEASQPVPETTSPALCAQYLNACVDLTRKLNAYKLSDDEMMMCFKYSMLRQCLGDVERAAQNIVFANQEIRLGVAYSIKHPIDPQTESQSTSSRQTTQSGVKGTQTAAPQLFCSTFNVESRADDSPHYSPSFTPIRRN